MKCNINKNSEKEVSESIKERLEQVSFFLGFIESNNITDYEITITKDGIKFRDIVAENEADFNIIRRILNKDN